MLNKYAMHQQMPMWVLLVFSSRFVHASVCKYNCANPVVFHGAKVQKIFGLHKYFVKKMQNILTFLTILTYLTTHTWCGGSPYGCPWVCPGYVNPAPSPGVFRQTAVCNPPETWGYSFICIYGGVVVCSSRPYAYACTCAPVENRDCGFFSKCLIVAFLRVRVRWEPAIVG